MAVAVLLACTGGQKNQSAGTINRPFIVDGARIEPDSLNEYLAARRGFTSRGGDMRCAYKPLGQGGTKVFVWAVCGELLAVDGQLVDGSGMSLPAAFEIEIDGGHSRVIGVEVPEDGNRYSASIRRIFPARTWSAIFANGGPNQPATGLGDYLRAQAAARFGLPPSAATASRLHAPPRSGLKRPIRDNSLERVASALRDSLGKAANPQVAFQKDSTHLLVQLATVAFPTVSESVLTAQATRIASFALRHYEKADQLDSVTCLIS